MFFVLLKICVTIQSLISQNLRFSSMWRIRQITSYKNMLMNASIHRIFLMKLLGSEQLHFAVDISMCFSYTKVNEYKGMII